jgi:uncharacterized membrane protein HdeD (DUF308 family)
VHPPGLPDGYFQTKNPNLDQFWRILQWKIYGHLVYVFYGHFLYVIYGHLAYLFPFWYVVARKIWQPWHQPNKPEAGS